MTDIEMEMIKAESVRHSENLSDWNNEAILKEFCWSIVDFLKHNRGYATPRFCRVAEELDKRIYEKSNQPHITDHLFYHQKKMCGTLCASSVNRKAELRKIEAILEIKTPIPDILLP